MFCSLTTDLIVGEIKCGQCLCELMNEWLNKKKSSGSCSTWFCRRALARCSAPCKPIRLYSRLSVTSVYVN
jgi:hypothetical protein